MHILNLLLMKKNVVKEGIKFRPTSMGHVAGYFLLHLYYKVT